MADTEESTAPEIQINVKGKHRRCELITSQSNQMTKSAIISIRGSSGPSELKLQINIATDKTVSELKQAVASKSDVPADRQRLIYSGRVLKVRTAGRRRHFRLIMSAPQDEDLLSVYKIQSGHTIHMVKGAARSGAAGGSSTSSTSSPAQQLPTNIQAGQNPHDPLTLLNSSLAFGHPGVANFNPFAELGLNPNDPNMMQTMMSSPQFLEQMGRMMSNPEIMEQVIAMNPQMAGMAPQMREMFNSEAFRQMM
jgi:ubiquilin